MTRTESNFLKTHVLVDIKRLRADVTRACKIRHTSMSKLFEANGIHNATLSNSVYALARRITLYEDCLPEGADSFDYGVMLDTYYNKICVLLDLDQTTYMVSKKEPEVAKQLPSVVSSPCTYEQMEQLLQSVDRLNQSVQTGLLGLKKILEMLS